MVGLAFTMVVSIAVASTVVQPYDAEWRWASELLRWVLLPPALMHAADIIPTDRATRLLNDRANTSAKLFPLRSGATPSRETCQGLDRLKRPSGKRMSRSRCPSMNVLKKRFMQTESD